LVGRDETAELRLNKCVNRRPYSGAHAALQLAAVNAVAGEGGSAADDRRNVHVTLCGTEAAVDARCAADKEAVKMKVARHPWHHSLIADAITWAFSEELEAGTTPSSSSNECG
jgi:hypothetical protein